MIFFIQDLVSYLTLGGLALIVVLVASFIFVKQSQDKQDFIGKAFGLLKNKAYLLIFLIAFFATLGSLFFSNVVGLPPCDLCWYQRILMYPLLLLFLVALIKKEKVLSSYALVFSSLGVIVALYQYYLQIGTMLNVKVGEIIPCSVTGTVSCASISDLAFGFVTLPLSSFVAFALIILLLVYDRK